MGPNPITLNRLSPRMSVVVVVVVVVVFVFLINNETIICIFIPQFYNQVKVHISIDGHQSLCLLLCTFMSS